MDLTLNIMDTGFSCTALIKAEVSAPLKSTTIVANDTDVSYPSVIVWHTASAWRGPYESLSASMIQMSADLLKQFANVWASSQKLDY